MCVLLPSRLNTLPLPCVLPLPSWLKTVPLRCVWQWNYGGFPWWINQVDVTVGDNSAFETAMKKWIGDLVEHIRPFLASNGGPVRTLSVFALCVSTAFVVLKTSP